MAPNRRKKKIVSNPARGFATISQPSKAKEQQEAEVMVRTSAQGLSAVSENSDVTLVDAGPACQHQNGTHEPQAIDTMTPEELEVYLEDQDLQNIVDAHVTRCEADANRQVTRLKNERRQLRASSLPVSLASWLPPDVIDDILTTQKQMTDSQSISAPSTLQINPDDTTLLVRLWTLNQVLSALQLPDVDLVIQYVLTTSMRKVIESSPDLIWGLREALEWHASSSDSNNLPDYEDGRIASLGDTDTTSEDVNISTSDSEIGEQSGHRTNSGIEIDRATPVSDPDLTPIPSSASEDEDPTSFTETYTYLQTALYRTLQRSNGGYSSKELEVRCRKLTTRLEKLRRDVLFDHHTAEAAWQMRLRELEIEYARSHRQIRNSRNEERSLGASPELAEELFAHDDEDILGNMFAAETQVEATGGDNDEPGPTIALIDFGKWTGVSPRKVLVDSCYNLDKSAKVVFATLSSSAHSTRQKVELIWSKSQIIKDSLIKSLPEGILYHAHRSRTTILMQTVAAATPAQAEAYLSTIALFTVHADEMADQKQFQRLPSVWRNVYHDLLGTERRIIESAAKIRLSELRQIIRSTLNSRKQTENCQFKNLVVSRERISAPDKGRHIDVRLSQSDLMSLWASKIASPAYGQLLVQRQQLPVYQYKTEILRTADANQAVVICADTGAGKSTQVPSFLLEHNMSNGNDCRILVTQPRRISAISLARRVSQELGERHDDIGSASSLVGYAIRLESKTSSSTRITFATTGVLLRMLEHTPNLDNLDYLILDEVHERTMELDLLFIALRKLQSRRNDLKIILMSATVNAQKFSQYFGNAPIVNVPGRTFPVEVKYLEDAIEDTLSVRQKISNRVVKAAEDDTDTVHDETDNMMSKNPELDDYSHGTRAILAGMDERRIDYELLASLIEVIFTNPKYNAYSKAVLIFMPGIAEIRRLQSLLSTIGIFTHRCFIHLLHSSFSTEELEAAFVVPDAGHRKIVIATNIAETGITIPDITAVVDTCKEKIMRFDERRQLSRLTESFISRSSARQRRGRAARVRDGLCFHLVTKHRYDNALLDQHVPEMLRLGLQDPILRIKIWNLGSIEETLSAAIDPPSQKNINRAIERLKETGALDSSENLTALGRHLARLPLDILPGKLALFGLMFSCLDAVVTIVASLMSRSPFLDNRDSSGSNVRLPFARADSDLITTLNAYQGWRKVRSAGGVHQYCRRNRLSDQNLNAIEEQKIQLLIYLVDAGLLRLDNAEKNVLSQARSSGSRRSTYTLPGRFNIHENDGMLCAVIAMAFHPRFLTREARGWRNIYSNQNVKLAFSSINRVERPPKWLCYYEAMQTKTGTLNALETSKIPEAAILMLIGEADFKYFSGIVTLDGSRMRFSVRQWKHLAAVHEMRGNLMNAIRRCWQTPDLHMSAVDHAWLDLLARILAQSTKGRT